LLPAFRPGLFLWTDEQRADTLSVYGNHRFRMPTLNRLASESVVFDRCSMMSGPGCRRAG
jgi:arylsulfatase A-like enzyme